MKDNRCRPRASCHTIHYSIFLMFSKVKFYKHKTGATMDSNQHEINFSKINKYVN